MARDSRESTSNHLAMRLLPVGTHDHATTTPRPRHEAAQEAAQETTMDAAPRSRLERSYQYSAELNWRSSHLFDKLSILVAAVAVNDAEKHEPLRVSCSGSIAVRPEVGFCGCVGGNE